MTKSPDRNLVTASVSTLNVFGLVFFGHWPAFSLPTLHFYLDAKNSVLTLDRFRGQNTGLGFPSCSPGFGPELSAGPFCVT